MSDPWIGDPDQPLLPLWRGLIVYRCLTLASAVAVTLWKLDEYARPVWKLDDYARPAAAVAVLGVMVVWTAVTAFGYLRSRRRALALADLTVTLAVLATTPLVQTPAQIAADAPVMGSIWTACAVMACALVFGVRGGIGGTVVLAVVILTVSAKVSTEVVDIELILLAASTIGFASTVLRRSAARLQRAIAAEAAARERERLARAVHDGVLQVLGYVRRRGAELGGDAGELGELAGGQEFALRALLTTGSAPVDADGRRDLAAALRVLGSATVTVATPAHAVDLPAHTVDELVAVVAAALSNVERHVGAGAPAWVSLEEMAGVVEISVRDEGPGIPAGRLAATEADGRMGVARSMRGRVEDLGGMIACETGPGGTEWIITMEKA